MTNAKVSIIVPFHNTEKYIGVCLKSLTGQTYSDIEIICINDGSTDSSRAIVEEFQKKDERVRLLNQKNSGVGIARKRGLQIASGKYIMFCDSDDYYEHGMVTAMAECMETHADIDLASCSIFIHRENERERYISPTFFHKENRVLELTQFIKGKETLVLWNKIFRKNLWDQYKIDIGLPNIPRGEDANLVEKYLSVSQKIFHSKKQLYHHTIRKDSITEKFDKYFYLLQDLTYIDNWADFLDSNNLWPTNADFYARKVLNIIDNWGIQNFNTKQKQILCPNLIKIARRVKNWNIINTQVRNAIYTVQNGHIKDSYFPPQMDIIKTEKSVPIVFALDDNYIKYLPVTLQSIIENSSQDYIYHIIILDCGITPENTDIIQRQIAEHTNFTLNIISAKAFLEKNKEFFKGKSHFTAASYGRLFIPEIFSTFDKVIYAEVDMIFNRDIAELTMIDLEDNYIAAVISISMEARFNAKKEYSYIINELRADSKSYYIYSGLMVFNIKEWNKNNLANICIDILKEHVDNFSYPDQHAINLACKNKIHYLDQSWNCTPFLENRLAEEDCVNLIEKDSFMENCASQFMAALNSPHTVFHYAASKKPWNSSEGKFNRYWWAYCRKTESYEEILFQSTSRQFQDHVIGINPKFPDLLPQEMKNSSSRYISLIKKYYLLGIAVIKIKLTNESKKYYLFGMRIAKTVKNQHKKKYYILGLRIFTLKVWKN